jgi:hypothetical protein
MKPLTLEQAKSLRIGTILYHRVEKNSDGSPQRWKVNGGAKTWIHDSTRVKIPVRHGLYNYGYVTEFELDSVSLEEN